MIVFRKLISALVITIGTYGCAGDSSSGRHSSASSSAPLCAEEAQVSSPLRRLNRFEYGRSVEDLTGVNRRVAEHLPPDERTSLGFDNDAEAYSVSTLHATKYLEAAEDVAEEFITDSTRLEAFADCNPLSDEECVEKFLAEFGRRAWRRPLSSSELQRMVALFETTSVETPEEGLSAVVATMLQAPQFLYRPEFLDDAQTLDPYALATRLSYLVVGSLPDEQLLQAAEDGTLSSQAGIASETERLLADPRAVEAFTRFVSEWWELDELDTVQKDRSLFRAWNTDTPATLLEESRLFLSDAWRATPTLELLLTAPYTYLNPTLADFYGLPIGADEDFVRTELGAERASGLLTQGAFLAAHAKANQTSPVHRGKFVRSRLFCDPPPPPPPNIVVKAPAVDPRLPTRERFAQHAEDPSCASCHALMDPIGFAFEHYDAVGRYRETDAGEPVDARGTLVGTDVDGDVDGLQQLTARLLESEQVRACVATQWFRYAFGRSESADDGCAVDALTQQLEKSGGDLLAMLKSTVRLQTFHGNAEAAAGEEP